MKSDRKTDSNALEEGETIIGINSGTTIVFKLVPIFGRSLVFQSKIYLVNEFRMRMVRIR